MGCFEAVLFDAGDTLIRLSGNGEELLHRAAAALGVDPLDPDEVVRVCVLLLPRPARTGPRGLGQVLSLL